MQVPGPGEVIGGKYRVDGTLATGGMGVVLRATHLHLREKVAIKILRPDVQARPESVARFMREARMTMKLRGEHVVRVFDVDLIDGAPYIVMELLEGEDLALRIGEGGPIAPDVAVGLLLQLCEGVAEAHAIGIVHRDLKPANVFVTRGDVIKVLDFGVSKASSTLLDEGAVTASGSDPRIPAARPNETDTDVDLTSTRTTLGSPRYMSPEQIRCARDVDERSDIWAIGAIAHEMLSGDPPFEDDDLEALRAAITADAPKSLAAPDKLRAVVERCLAKDPSERFADVRELERALRGTVARERGWLGLVNLVKGRAALVALAVSVAAVVAVAWPRAEAQRALATPAPTVTTDVHPAIVGTTAAAMQTATASATATASVDLPKTRSLPRPARSASRAAASADDHVFDNPE
jgi:serine/threonine-protein kinase